MEEFLDLHFPLGSFRRTLEVCTGVVCAVDVDAWSVSIAVGVSVASFSWSLGVESLPDASDRLCW